MERSNDPGFNLPLEGKGDREAVDEVYAPHHVHCQPDPFCFSAFGVHLISRLRRQLEVNCREAAREATLGCPLKGKANQIVSIITKTFHFYLYRFAVDWRINI